MEMPFSEEWKDWVIPKGIVRSFTFPIFNPIEENWIVWKNDGSDCYMIVPHSDYIEEYSKRNPLNGSSR